MPFNTKALEELLNYFTQDELAEELESSQSTIYRWLHTSHKPKVEMIDKMYLLAAKYEIFDIDFYKPPIVGE